MSDGWANALSCPPLAIYAYVVEAATVTDTEVKLWSFGLIKILGHVHTSVMKRMNLSKDYQYSRRMSAVNFVQLKSKFCLMNSQVIKEVEQ